jgi:hypothetical protein
MEMKQTMQKMMERLLAKMEARLEWLQAKEEAHLGRMEAALGLRPWGKVTEACPEKSKAGPEEMEATNLEVAPEEMEGVMERQELHKEEANMDTLGSYENRHIDRHLVMLHRRRLKKRARGNSGG